MIPISLTAILCVGVYTGAYISEIIRTGIEAVPKGQTEAALSQGFTYADTMRIIILPQDVYKRQEENDRAMLEVVGSPVVMENGNPELKKIAKHITKSNDESGVAYAIRKWVL